MPPPIPIPGPDKVKIVVDLPVARLERMIILILPTCFFWTYVCDLDVTDQRKLREQTQIGSLFPVLL